MNVDLWDQEMGKADEHAERLGQFADQLRKDALQHGVDYFNRVMKSRAYTKAEALDEAWRSASDFSYDTKAAPYGWIDYSHKMNFAPTKEQIMEAL